MSGLTKMHDRALSLYFTCEIELVWKFCMTNFALFWVHFPVASIYSVVLWCHIFGGGREGTEWQTAGGG